MKCQSCGYEHEDSYEGGVYKTIVGDEKFIRIDFLNQPFETDKDVGDYYIEYMKVYLYGCPKCKSVQYNSVL